MLINRINARGSICWLIACFMLCVPLAQAADPCLLGPEGGVCPICKTDPPVTCDSCCPAPSKPDYTCKNATVAAYVDGNLSQCASCDAIVREADKCRPTDACPKTSCPTGQDLINPDSKNCYCQKHDEFCQDIGDVTALSVRSYHPDFTLGGQSMDAFTQDAASKIALSTEGALNNVSPCMEQVRKNCAEKFVGGYGFGFSSYRQLVNIDGRRVTGLTTQDSKNFNAWLADHRKAGNTTDRETLWRAHIAPPLTYLDSCIKASLTQGQALGSYNNETQSFSGAKGSQLSIRSSTVYLQSDCRPVEKWKQNIIKTCDVPITAYFNTYSSPVSLLWGEGTKIKDIFSRSKFPINPKEAGKWFVWKGSGKTPLVVWDPEGTGAIVAAKQLFGNHTFEKEWKNGYEPLGSLDKDHNDWLEGEELKGIALWFDFDQDGVSDTGEVKKPSDVGVFAIGTKSSQDDLKNGNIFADKGYKRKVGDKVIEGRSVDWFSGSVEGRFGVEALYGGSSADGGSTSDANLGRRINPSKDVAGIWDWRMVDFSKQELPENMPRGSFTLLVDDNGISGTSYVMQETAPNKSGIGEQLVASQITGSLSNVAGKNPGVIFTSVTPNGGKVESKAVLSDDGRLMYGETTEESGPNRDSIRYGWVASRFSGY